MKKRLGIVKIVGLLLILVVLSFGAYIIKYQLLVNEGSRLADQHCLVVNPLIIQRKQAYIDLIEITQINPNLYMEFNNKYLDYSKKYLTAEKQWLKTQDAFMNRWDVKWLVDKNIQAAGALQYKMYLADYQGTDALVKAFETKDPREQERLMKIVAQTGNDAIKAQEAYVKAWDNKPTGFVRNYLIKVPTSKCPAENFDFPDVTKALIQ